MEWAYALNEIYGKDKEMLEDVSGKIKNAVPPNSAPQNIPYTVPMQPQPKHRVQKSPSQVIPAMTKTNGPNIMTSGKRFVKTGKGQLKTELI